MKSLKTILLEKNIPFLIDFCKSFGIRGYSSLKKEEIINILIKNIKTPQFQDIMEVVMPDNGTIALIYKELFDNHGKIKYTTLKNQVLEERSTGTFRDNYKALTSQYVIFEEMEEKERIVYLPREFLKLARNIIDKRIGGEIKPLKEEAFSLEEMIYTCVDELSGNLSKLSILLKKFLQLKREM